MRFATIGWTRKIRNADANVVAANSSTPGGTTSRSAARCAGTSWGTGSGAAVTSGRGSMDLLIRTRHDACQAPRSASERGRACFAHPILNAGGRVRPAIPEKRMSLQLGDVAPDFEIDSTEGRIRFHDWIGNGWAVLFSHPKDFTPACTPGPGGGAGPKPEFEKRGGKVIGLSVDPVSDHRKWAADIEETQGAALNFPLIGDPDRSVSSLYDMIHPNANDTLTVRSVFVIGPDKKIKLTITYPA